MKSITQSFQLTRGLRVTCKIKDVVITDAKLQVSFDSVYVCQNQVNGNQTLSNKLGFKYAWLIYNSGSMLNFFEQLSTNDVTGLFENKPQPIETSPKVTPDLAEPHEDIFDTHGVGKRGHTVVLDEPHAGVEQGYHVEEVVVEGVTYTPTEINNNSLDVFNSNLVALEEEMEQIKIKIERRKEHKKTWERLNAKGWII